MGIVASSRKNGALSDKKTAPFFDKPTFFYVFTTYATTKMHFKKGLKVV